jgi:hypothetical protein
VIPRRRRKSGEEFCTFSMENNTIELETYSKGNVSVSSGSSSKDNPCKISRSISSTVNKIMYCQFAAVWD